MSAAVLSLVGCGLCWAALDVQRKRLAQGVDILALGAALAFLGLPTFAAVGAFTHDPGFDLARYLPRTLAAAAFSAWAHVTFLRALAIAPLSVCLPLLALSPVFAAGFGVIWLGDPVRAMQAVGIAAVACGAWLLPHSVAPGMDPAAAARGRQLMLVVAVAWGLVAVIDRDALRFASPLRHGAVQCGVVGAGLLIVLAARGRFGALRTLGRRPGLLALSVFTGSAALGLQYAALQGLDAGSVESVKRAMGLTLALVNGRLLFGEHVTLRHVLAAALMAAGVPLVLG